MNKSIMTAEIKRLEAQLRESRAHQASGYSQFSQELPKMALEHMMGSSIILTLEYVGGHKTRPSPLPVAIRDGLSQATIDSLRADLKRSYDLATLMPPK